MAILGPGKKPVFNVAKPTIRVEKVAISKLKPSFTSSSSSTPRSSSTSRATSSLVSSRKPSTVLPARPLRSKSSIPALRTSASPAPRFKSTSPLPSGDERSRKRKASSPNTAAATPKFDDSDSEEDDWQELLSRKKPRLNTGNIVRDPKRIIRNLRSFAILGQESPNGTSKCVPNGAANCNANGLDKQSQSNGNISATIPNKPLSAKVNAANLSSITVTKRNTSLAIKPLKFIHAADLVASDAQSDPSKTIKFQYPASRLRERYELVVARDKIDPTSDILSATRNITDVYLTESQAQPFTDPETGLIRRFEKAINRSSNDDFKATLADYNNMIRKLMDNGAILANLSHLHELPSSLVHFVLGQCYDRAVAPNIEKVNKYQAGSDYVYGELKAQFITELLVNKISMKSDQVFVDLGSGVGNVVLQAALEIGCESWGWEYQEECCNLADAQVKEFRARCQLWGLSHGRVSLGRGDFCKSDKVMEVLQRADVVLVNNQVFSSTLNSALVHMFLDLKPGCKIVSLKSFVHEGKGSNGHNANDVGNTILDVDEFTYPEDWVSWTARGGTYYISTRK